jgi:hypothetical protein
LLSSDRVHLWRAISESVIACNSSARLGLPTRINLKIQGINLLRLYYYIVAALPNMFMSLARYLTFS